jgi:2-succinyl-5-enolpyruvyl-6-hydroxy-3-cyclohexene-1-carboxylate synthase
VALGDVSLACAWALVDELVRGGVRHACVSPGSRSTPLALALARHPGVELQIHLDERSSAFVSLGLAKATGTPVIAACTSGTATAELFPAVVEASRSRAPLVVLTADRPPRLRGTGANQTIDQGDLYGAYADFLEPPVPTTAEDEERWRAVGRDALLGTRRSWQPVQVNCPFDEPLTPSPGATLEASTRGRWEPPRAEPLSGEDVERFAAELAEARGVVVIGGMRLVDAARVDLRVFDRLGWPVLAEPISNLRRPGTLSAGQALIGAHAWVDSHRPEVILQLGATPTMREMQAFVGSAERLVVADRVHPDPDPEGLATWRLRADAPAVANALSSRSVQQPAPDGWIDAWQDADARVRRVLDDLLDAWEEPFEPRVARDVAAAVPPGGALFVGSSTPVRDLDLAMVPREDVQVFANRGASGIDGSVSTAIGVATARKRPTTALLGDLAWIYDLGAVAWNARRIDLDLTVVIVDNGGGHIFSQLPQRELPEHRNLFVTPHELNISAVCAAFGVPYVQVERAGDLTVAMSHQEPADGMRIVHVVVPSTVGLRRREKLRRACADALA